MKNSVKLNPTVCIVGKTYQIIIISEQDALISVRVGDKVYYNHSNGIRISSAGVHKIFIPAEVLDIYEKQGGNIHCHKIFLYQILLFLQVVHD